MYAFNIMNQFDGVVSGIYGGPQFDGLEDFSENTQNTIYGRSASTDQSYTSGSTSGYIVFDTPSNSYGAIPITTSNNYFFQNSANSTKVFNVTFNVTWKSDNANLGLKQCWINKNNSATDRFGFTSIHHQASGTQAVVCSAAIVLAPGEYIGCQIYQNTGDIQTIDGTTSERCRLQITQI